MLGASRLLGARGSWMANQAGVPVLAVAREQAQPGQQRWLCADNSDPWDELHGKITARAQQQQRSVTVVCGLKLGGDLPGACSIPRVPPSFPVRGLVCCRGAMACLYETVGRPEPLLQPSKDPACCSGGRCSGECVV